MQDWNENEKPENTEQIDLKEEVEQEKFAKTFTKSNKNKVLFGVCGGIANYLKIQPAIIRIIFSLAIFIGGWGLIFYLVAAFTMPSAFEADPLSEKEKFYNLNREIKVIFSVLIIFIGLYEILNAYNFWIIISFFGFSTNYYEPVLILAAGIAITIKSFQIPSIPQPDEERQLFRSNSDKSIFGVAAGLAKYFNVSSVFVRTLLMIIFFLTGGVISIAYLVMGITIPKEGRFV